MIIVSNFGDRSLGKISLIATDTITLSNNNLALELDQSNFDPARLPNFYQGVYSQNFTSQKGSEIFIKARYLDIQNYSLILSKNYNNLTNYNQGGDVVFEIEKQINIKLSPPLLIPLAS
jgi:hypothetical protein